MGYRFLNMTFDDHCDDLINEASERLKAGEDKSAIKSHMTTRLKNMFPDQYPSEDKYKGIAQIIVAQAMQLLKHEESQKAKNITINITNIENSHSFNLERSSSPVVSEPHPSPQNQPDDKKNATGDDPYRFHLGNQYDLEAKLTAHKYFARALDECNTALQKAKKRILTVAEVAQVGCLWRKNIHKSQSSSDPGAVPMLSMIQFQNRSKADKKLTSYHIGQCLNILEAVGFLVRTRSGNKQTGRCAAYQLLNEAAWT